MTNDEIMHNSTINALVFAFNFSDQQFAKSTLARKMGGLEQTKQEGRGLVAETGAGDAGFIWNELYALAEQNPLYLAVLYARYAPRDYLCTCGSLCCSGNRKNKLWVDVINYLTKEAASHIDTPISHHRVRQAIILNIFARSKSERRSLVDVADRCGVHRETVGKYNASIRKWICGGNYKVDGEVIRVTGIELMAFDAIDQRLREMGEVAA